MHQQIMILGSSGLARELAWMITQIDTLTDKWQLSGFISKDPSEIGMDLGFAKVIGDDNWLLNQDFSTDIVVGIGYPKVRARIIGRYLEQAERFSFPNLIHPNTTLDHNYVEIGQGNVFMAGSRFTCNIKLNDFNLFNPNVTIGHDVKIGSFNVVNPGANISGGVIIDDRILVGVGSQILENIFIGSDATIGASALVRATVSEGQTVIGIPAHPLLKK